MKKNLTLVLLVLLLTGELMGQRNCVSHQYEQNQILIDPSLLQKIREVESFTTQHLHQNNDQQRPENAGVIHIPVVVHVLYHDPGQNISAALINSQIAALNRDFRRRNADSIRTTAGYRQRAADCEIEFQLATSDPNKRSTNGIIRKYTPITEWAADDKVKFSSEMGDDGWDSHSYLNIWVCNLSRIAGYSCVPGGPDNKDGFVIGFPFFGVYNEKAAFGMGRTAVHEAGHWLNLKHIWGDIDCGNDFVDDTPTQSFYNIECPSDIRITCNNGPYGDMYQNYMDFTNDPCMNLFTKGQKERMRTLFEPGGIRNAMLNSTGLDKPLYQNAQLPEDSPTWLYAQLYPNPAINNIILDLSYDIRWIGKTFSIFDLQGRLVRQVVISSKLQNINIEALSSGVYIISGRKDDGEELRKKFVKE